MMLDAGSHKHFVGMLGRQHGVAILHIGENVCPNVDGIPRVFGWGAMGGRLVFDDPVIGGLGPKTNTAGEPEKAQVRR